MKSPYTRTIRTIYGSARGRSPFFLERPQARHRVWLATLALVLLSAAVGASFYFFGQTGPAFTGDRLEVSFSGNIEPKVGKTEEYVLRLTNKEEVTVTNVELFIDFARAGRRSGNGTSTASANMAPITLVAADPEPALGAGNTWQLGEIKSGDMREIKLNLSFLGKEGLEIILPTLVSFRPSGWGGDFSSRLEQKFKLGSPLVAMEIAGPGKVVSGGEAALTVIVKNPFNRSASANPLRQLADGQAGAADDWLLSFALPDGFTVISFEPALPVASAAVTDTGAPRQPGWPLAALPRRGDDYTLSVRGRVELPAGSELLLTALLSNQKIGGLKISAEKKITVRNTDVEFSLVPSPAVGKKPQWGETVNWQATLRNIGQETLRDGVVGLALSGEDLWRSDSLVIGSGGSWEAGSIVWDKESYKELTELAPGKKLTLNFSFTLIKEPPALSPAAAVILAAGHFTAASDDGNIEARSGEVVLKIVANLDLAAAAWYHPPLPDESPPLQEPVPSLPREGVRGGSRGGGSGPHPPLPGQETTYAAEWVMGPSTGALAEARLSAALPRDVVWKEGRGAPVGELSYEQASRTVVWRAADLPRLTESKNIRFTIGLTPSDQVTNDLPVLGATSFSAKDVFSGEILELYAPAVRLGEVR